MNFSDFFAALENPEARIENCYLFYGEEDELIQEAVGRLVNRCAPVMPELNAQRVDGGVRPTDLAEMLCALPLLSSRRVVVVWDFAPLLGKKKKTGRSEEEDIKAIGDALGDHVVLVLASRGALEKSNEWVKMAAHWGAAVAFDRLTFAEASPWIMQNVRDAGGSMEPSAARLLFEMTGGRLGAVRRETEKLVAFADGCAISPEMVSALGIPTSEYKIYSFAQALTDGKTRQAVSEYQKLVREGEPRAIILSVLEGQLRAYAWADRAKASGLPVAYLAKALGVRDFVLTNAMRRRTPLSQQALEEAIEDCARLDAEVKQGLLQEDAALDGLVIKLVCAIAR